MMNYRTVALRYIAAGLADLGIDDDLLTGVMIEDPDFTRYSVEDRNAVAAYVIEIGAAMAAEIDALVEQIEAQDKAA